MSNIAIVHHSISSTILHSLTQIGGVIGGVVSCPFGGDAAQSAVRGRRRATERRPASEVRGRHPPLANLYVALLDKLGIHLDKFGDRHR